MNVSPENKTESYRIFDKIAKTYDFLNIILSLGIDRLWRRKIIRIIGKANVSEAVDLATGTGDMAILLAQSKNIHKVKGLDLSKEMIAIGNEKIAKKNLSSKATLEIGNGMDIPLEDSSTDLLTITFGIRNFGDFEKGLREMHRVLRDSGRCIIMEFSLPKNKFIKSFYLFYFRHVLPFVGNIISRDKMAYTYLNQTVEQFPYGNDFAKKMKDAGFTSVNIHPLTFGIASIYEAKK